MTKSEGKWLERIELHEKKARARSDLGEARVEGLISKGSLSSWDGR